MDIYWAPGEPLEGPERWYPVIGYEGIYEVSTLGRLRRIAGGKGTRVKNGVPYVLATHPNSKGYPIVNLWRDGERVTTKVHRIVARAFLGEPPVDIAGNYEIHHKPDAETGVPDKTDNRAFMIEYRSAYDNQMEMQHRYYKTGQTY